MLLAPPLDWARGNGLHPQSWSALSRLSHLSLHAWLLPDDDAALEGISHLARLEQLKLDCWQAATVIPPAMLSGLQRLTQLELHCGHLQPAALGCVTQLPHLDLDNTVMQPGGAAGTAALLAALARLQQLTALGGGSRGACAALCSQPWPTHQLSRPARLFRSRNWQRVSCRQAVCSTCLELGRSAQRWSSSSCHGHPPRRLQATSHRWWTAALGCRSCGCHRLQLAWRSRRCQG